MKNQEKLIQEWLAEEKAAHIIGWDFSHIADRFEEEQDLPWDYPKIVKSFLSDNKKLLDMDTGGAEFLLSLNHPYKNTSATEAYLPNVSLCKKRLLPLGIDFKQANARERLPFEDEIFDIVINRHGAFLAEELWRVLKPNGIFITEQVGDQNDRELVELLLNHVPPLPFPDHHLSAVIKRLEKSGFSIRQSEEVFRPIRFFDVGALVWFAHIIEWEFPGFSVQECKNNLLQAQKILETNGCIRGNIHRFLIVAEKED